MTLYAKTFPGSDGSAAVRWYRMAATAADQSGDPAAQMWVRGRAAIALGYEGASLGVADVLGDQALALSDKPSLGLLNAIYGKAHAAALRGDRATALALALATQGRRVFDSAGSHEQTSDYAVPWWRLNVFRSLLLARLGEEHAATDAQDQALALPPTLPRFATHHQLHQGLMLARSGDPDQRNHPRHHRNERPPPGKAQPQPAGLASCGADPASRDCRLRGNGA